MYLVQSTSPDKKQRKTQYCVTVKNLLMHFLQSGVVIWNTKYWPARNVLTHMKTEQFIFWTHPLAEVILNRTDTPGNTTPPGINKSGNFLGIWAFSDDIVLIMSVSLLLLPLCNLFCLYQINYLVSWRTVQSSFSVYIKISTYLMNRYTII